MTNRLYELVQELKSHFIDTAEYYEMNTSEVSTSVMLHIDETISLLNMAIFRLPNIENITEYNEKFQDLTQNIEKIIKNIQNNYTNVENISNFINETNKALNFVMGHVEPEEPWPREDT